MSSHFTDKCVVQCMLYYFSNFCATLGSCPCVSLLSQLSVIEKFSLVRFSLFPASRLSQARFSSIIQPSKVSLKVLPIIFRILFCQLHLRLCYLCAQFDRQVEGLIYICSCSAITPS